MGDRWRRRHARRQQRRHLLVRVDDVQAAERVAEEGLLRRRALAALQRALPERQLCRHHLAEVHLD